MLLKREKVKKKKITFQLTSFYRLRILSNIPFVLGIESPKKVPVKQGHRNRPLKHAGRNPIG